MLPLTVILRPVRQPHNHHYSLFWVVQPRYIRVVRKDYFSQICMAKRSCPLVPPYHPHGLVRESQSLLLLQHLSEVESLNLSYLDSESATTCPPAQRHRQYCFQDKHSSDRRQLSKCAQRELVTEARARNRCNRARRLKVKRSVVCEGSIGTMKNYGGLSRARWLGAEAMAIQCLMAGTVLDFKLCFSTHCEPNARNTAHVPPESSQRAALSIGTNRSGQNRDF